MIDFRPLDTITEKDIEELIAEQVPEGKRLDYKRDLPAEDDKSKREFLSDVTSFANASGGVLIYGVEEDEGYPKRIVPIQASNPDVEIQRLDNIIASGVEPRIHGIEIQDVKVGTSGCVFLLRIPQSWSSPHMVTFRGQSRFYSRVSRGKYQLDVNELRNAFIMSGDLVGRIRASRESRILGIHRGLTPVPMGSAAMLVLQITPLGSFSAGNNLDLKEVVKSKQYLMPIGIASCSCLYNLDGYLSFCGSLEESFGGSLAYTQVYRNGTIESTRSISSWSKGNPSMLPALAIERGILEAIESFLAFYRRLVVDPPFVVSLSVLGVKGFQIGAGPHGIPRETTDQVSTRIDREDLLLPDVVLDEYNADIGLTMKVPFDALWNSAGWSGSMGYDREGRRKPESE